MLGDHVLLSVDITGEKHYVLVSYFKNEGGGATKKLYKYAKVM